MAHTKPGKPGQAPEPPIPEDPDPAESPNPTIEHADDDEPAYDEVEIVDTDEFGEPIEPSGTDDDADDWDKTEI
jgi:hypothetical protein